MALFNIVMSLETQYRENLRCVPFFFRILGIIGFMGQNTEGCQIRRIFQNFFNLLSEFC